MPSSGTVSLKVPNWYQSASTKQGAMYDKFVGSMLDFDSVATLASSQAMKITTRFDQSSSVYQINYESTEEWSNELVLVFSNFKNPVSRAIMGGFQVFTSDSRSYTIDRTNVDIELSTAMTETQPLLYSDFQLLGDN